SMLAHPVDETAPEQELTLTTALGLAGVDNPTIALAEEAVRGARAAQLEAGALILPDLTLGLNYYSHDGALQTGTGLIRLVNREGFFVGSGADAVGAGTVVAPGIHLFAHLGDAAFEPRAAAQRLLGRQFTAAATRNSILLDVADRYLALSAAQQRRRAM